MVAQVSVRPHTVRDVAYVAYRHSVLYTAEYQLDDEFGRYVLLSLAQFVEKDQPDTDRLWIAEVDGEFAGCIGVVGLPEQEAQLRWFLVEPRFRRHGVGTTLVQQVIDFCRARACDRIILWTISELEGARRLYSRFGFQLMETQTHFVWGATRTEERWGLVLETPQQPAAVL